ncbi:MAG: hypothetical protein PF495_08005 [Spirochaetales bacterium]|nr:hypothetical protein [Spirochaetales bacterium]
MTIQIYTICILSAAFVGFFFGQWYAAWTSKRKPIWDDDKTKLPAFCSKQKI